MSWQVEFARIDWFSASGFVIAIATLWVLVGRLRLTGLLVDGDARKINHAAVLVGGVAWFWTDDPVGDRSTCHAAVVALFLLLVLVCHYRDVPVLRLAFVGYARESDRPHDGFHVWFSWLVSILGLELADLAYGSLDLTRVAALVLGIGDAVAEPIGTRFGRHRYFVRDLASRRLRQRSWEGSLAVGVGTAMVILVAIGVASPATLVNEAVILSLVTGCFIALVEAWTPHGLDNFTIPLCTACWLRWLLAQ